jgi:KaiC/GvpD/RAD55 family RecA-like ATPase
MSVPEVLAAWRLEGRLVHEPTGFAKLDELTGGGPVYGTRWYIAGAPDAGKTAWLIQVAHQLAARGVAVGLLAVDEEAGDIVTRLAQRVGYHRSDCEYRYPDALDAIGAALADLPIRIYDAEWTIEGAAGDLGAFAAARAAADPATHPHGPRALLCIDSLQTVRCDAEALATRETSEVAAVTARVRAIRNVATKYRLITITTSELGRGSYSSGDPAKQTPTIAGGKWSGAIEYSARVLLGLRSVPGESDLLDLEVAKNKHGPLDHVHLRIDRRSQALWEVAYEPEPESDRDSEREARARSRATRDAGVAALVLAERPGIVRRELEAAVRAAGVGTARACAAVARLGAAVVVAAGERRAQRHFLDGASVPPEVLATLTPEHQITVKAARSPAHQKPEEAP